MSTEDERTQPRATRSTSFWIRGVVVVVLVSVIGAFGYRIVQEWPGGGEAEPSPRSLTADDIADRLVQVPDDTLVIGIESGGRSRAYMLSAFTRPDEHVCNDLIDGVPVTVTYCDLDDCVRLFTAPGRREAPRHRGGGPRPSSCPQDAAARRREKLSPGYRPAARWRGNQSHSLCGLPLRPHDLGSVAPGIRTPTFMSASCRRSQDNPRSNWRFHQGVETEHAPEEATR